MLLYGRLGTHMLFIAISLLFQSCRKFNHFHVNVITNNRCVIGACPYLRLTDIQGSVPMHVMPLLGSLYNFRLLAASPQTATLINTQVIISVINRGCFTGPQSVFSWSISNWIERFRYLRLYTISFTSVDLNPLSLIKLFACKSSFA